MQKGFKEFTERVIDEGIELAKKDILSVEARIEKAKEDIEKLEQDNAAAFNYHNASENLPVVKSNLHKIFALKKDIIGFNQRILFLLDCIYTRKSPYVIFTDIKDHSLIDQELHDSWYAIIKYKNENKAKGT